MSVIDDIKGAICTYFNNHRLMDCPFIKSPTNAPAPVGKYVAVRMEDVEQHGSEMQPPPGENAVFAFQQVGTVSFTEVEGDGETLRMVRNLVQRKDFVSDAAANGFTVWNFSSIMPVDTFDGEFYVRQWRFTMQVNFADEIVEDVPRIESVGPLTLTGE